MKISEIIIPKEGYIDILFEEIEGNKADNGRLFWDNSFDDKYCCTGVIVNWRDNLENNNPIIRVSSIYKNIDNVQEK